jgi:hypothetical protein
MTKNQLINLIAFCILMENREGILGKSPDYIQEKFFRYVNKDDDSYLWGLDSENKKKLREYIECWLGTEYLNEIEAYEKE